MITININKAKTIAHEKRRAAREQEFAPLDKQATIPMFAAEAEAKRQVVREKYAVIQDEINTAASVEELTAVVSCL